MPDERARSSSWTAAALVLLLLSTGCLGPASEDGDVSGPKTIEPTNVPQSSSQDDDPAGSQANETEEPDQPPPGPRTIRHAMGETTIEETTERVVALEYNHVENLLALGLQPVGVADKDGYEEWVAAGELADDVVDVGTRAEPSLETIAELEPDLIVAISFRHEDIYDELSAIAPTLVFEGFPSDNDTDQYERMLSIFERTAEATVREERHDAVVDEMQQRFRELASRLSEANETDREVLLTQLFTYNGQPLARVFLDDSIAANVAERIGLANAWTKTQCSTGYGYCDVSKEGFADVQHAHFFYQAQPDDDPVEEEWDDDPVWNSYEFVREDRVYALGADAWMFGGPLMSQELADRIADSLLR